MMILYGLDFWNTMSPLLTPRWQQRVARFEVQEIGRFA